MTGLSNGQIGVLYSPHTSLNGAKLLLNKGPPRKVTIEDLSVAESAPTIITPHALPMFRDGEVGRGSKRKREKDRMDPRKSRRPELPVTGPGRGGRVGASATQHVVQNLVRDTTRDEDVRFSFVLIVVDASQGAVPTAFTPSISVPAVVFYAFGKHHYVDEGAVLIDAVDGEVLLWMAILALSGGWLV